MSLPIVRENSTFRLSWDLLSMILILASCILIPFQLAFQHEVRLLGTEIIYLIDLFFILDILLNFLTSHRSGGIEITDRGRIAKYYLRTFFPVDLLANLPLDLFFLWAEDIFLFNVSLVLVLRLPRLLRVARMLVIFSRWKRLRSVNHGYLRILRFIVIIILVIHWVACSWFMIAYVSRFPPDSWAVKAGVESAAISTQYLRSLYWAITTMTTVGYGDITPSRNIEYLFSMIVMLMGASMYALIIGNIASLLSNLDSARVKFWDRVESINIYLRSRQVPSILIEQILGYYEYIWAQHRGVKADILFGDLPGPLRLEILRHLTEDLQRSVPLFSFCTPSLRDVLLLALKLETFAPDGYIVQEGEAGDGIYFISRGEAEIAVQTADPSVCRLGAGDYFGNISLMLNEKRTASVHTLTFCEVFILSKAAFENIRQTHPEFREVLKKMSADKSSKISALVIEGIVL